MDRALWRQQRTLEMYHSYSEAKMYKWKVRTSIKYYLNPSKKSDLIDGNAELIINLPPRQPPVPAISSSSPWIVLFSSGSSEFPRVPWMFSWLDWAGGRGPPVSR